MRREQSVYASGPVLRSLRHCRSLTQLISSSLLSADLNDFPIKADLMYRSICTQSLSRIDCSQMSLPRPGPGAVIQKSSALSGPNVMRPGCAHANKTKCQHWLSAHHSQLCSGLWLNRGYLWKTFSKDVCMFIFLLHFAFLSFFMIFNIIHLFFPKLCGSIFLMSLQGCYFAIILVFVGVLTFTVVCQIFMGEIQPFQ